MMASGKLTRYDPPSGHRCRGRGSGPGRGSMLGSSGGWCRMTDEAVVLVAEDEPELADHYAHWLSQDYTVRTAYDGQAALDRLDGEVDVVFLDRRMPELSGDQVLECIREAGFECRVAMLTAVDPDFDIIEMGFDEYLCKPVTSEELLDAANRLITRSTYDEKLGEYLALVTKRSSLRAEKPEAVLARSDEYAELEDRIAELEAVVDPIARDFDDDDLAAVLRDIPASS